MQYILTPEEYGRLSQARASAMEEFAAKLEDERAKLRQALATEVDAALRHHYLVAGSSPWASIEFKALLDDLRAAVNRAVGEKKREASPRQG